METKKLYRSRTERMVAGVCGGLADFFNIDPTIVRLIMVLLFLTGSAGIWIYLVLLFVVPEEPVQNMEVIDAPVISEEESTEE